MEVKIINIFVFILGLMLVGIGYLAWKLNKYTEVKNCVPTFADGDGPYYKQNSVERYKLVPDNNQGEKLVISGKLLRSDCKTPIANAVLDIWQADENGTYQDDWYRGRIKTDKRGNYRFETVWPKGYGEGTAFRPPHVHFKVWENNNLLITSEMFFPDVRGKQGFNDAYIMRILSKISNGKHTHRGFHDIILP